MQVKPADPRSELVPVLHKHRIVWINANEVLDSIGFNRPQRDDSRAAREREKDRRDLIEVMTSPCGVQKRLRTLEQLRAEYIQLFFDSVDELSFIPNAQSAVHTDD